MGMGSQPANNNMGGLGDIFGSGPSQPVNNQPMNDIFGGGAPQNNVMGDIFGGGSSGNDGFGDMQGSTPSFP